MPRRIKQLLKGKMLTAIESVTAEEPLEMQWLSELYSDPKITIINEKTNNLATHVLILITYRYPESYKEELALKRKKILFPKDEKQEYERREETLEETFGITGGGSKVKKKELSDGGKHRSYTRTDGR